MNKLTFYSAIVGTLNLIIFGLMAIHNSHSEYAKGDWRASAGVLQCVTVYLKEQADYTPKIVGDLPKEENMSSSSSPVHNKRGIHEIGEVSVSDVGSRVNSGSGDSGSFGFQCNNEKGWVLTSASGSDDGDETDVAMSNNAGFKGNNDGEHTKNGLFIRCCR